MMRIAGSVLIVLMTRCLTVSVRPWRHAPERAESVISEEEIAEDSDESEERYDEMSRLIAGISKLSGLELGRLITALRRQEKSDDSGDHSVHSSEKVSRAEYSRLIRISAEKAWNAPASPVRAIKLPNGAVRYTTARCTRQDDATPGDCALPRAAAIA